MPGTGLGSTFGFAVKGGEAEAQAMVDAFPNGAKLFHLQGQPGAGPAIDRNKGVHNVLDPLKDKYQIIFEQTANFARAEALTVTEAAQRLIRSLTTTAEPRNREEEARKARERSLARFPPG